MNEVSCRALWLNLEIPRRLGVPLERLTDGLDVSPGQLMNPALRVGWETMCELHRRLEALCGGPDELERLSGLYVQAPFLAGISSIAGLMTSPRTLYWSAHRWLGHAMFTVVASTFEDLPGGRIRVTLRIPEPWRDSPQFFRINAGVFRTNPRLLGLRDAMVEWQLSPRQAVYVIDPPPSLTLWARLKRFLRFLFATGTALQELGQQQAQLNARFEQLQLAHGQIATQSNQLKTVSLLGRELTRFIDLKLLAEAIVRLLSERFGASGIQVQLANGADVPDRLVHEWGARPGSPSRTVTLTSGGQRLGRIALWGLAPAHDIETDLLESLVPWLSIAIDNARSFALLRDYQADLEKKVSERTAQLEQSLQVVTETNRQKSEFFANAAHELRTPLTLTLAPLETLAQNRDLPPDVRTEVDGALRNGYRLLKLVNDVLDLARVDAGRMRLQVGPTDLARLIAECVRQWKTSLAGRNLKFEVELPASLPMTADAERLEQVILNLVSNAVKHTPDGGVIRLAAQEAGGGVELTVENDGEGIDAEDLPRLFDRFAQSMHSRSRRYGSSGLGLPVVRELVELHGGRVSAESPPGARALFRVWLPLGPRADEARTVDVPRPSHSELQQYELSSIPEAPVATASLVAPSDKPLLLVAEDNGELRAFIARGLHADFQVLEAADGATALELARKWLPDVILSDVMMPGMDGLAFCRAVRAEPAMLATPFVLLTARADIEDRLTGFEGGADDYLVKPFHLEELRARLRSQLRLRRLAELVAHSEKLAALGTLVAGVAHEVRNPLNGILNSLTPLRESMTGASPELRELVDVAIEGSRRVDLITSQLLEQSRSDLRNRSRVDLAQSLAVALRMLAHKVKAGPALATSITPGADLAVDGEPGSLSQVWINLVDNAIQAAGPSGHVDVAASREKDRVIIRVADDGPGIEARHLKRIFDPFFTTKPVGKGTGLGLSLVREIVARHGGEIAVDSAPGAGARFTVTLPSSGRASG